jgi:RNA polymerase primary sigma factor
MSVQVKYNIPVLKKSGAYQMFLNEAMKHKPLTSEQEKTATPEQLVKHNMLFAVSVASRFKCDGIDVMDLISESLIAMTIASKKFNHTKGVKFISYAVSWMQQRITAYIDNNHRNIRYPELISRARYAIEKRNLNDLTVDEIKTKIKFSAYYIKTAMSMIKETSLDLKYEDGDNVYEVSGDLQTDENIMKSNNIKLLTKNLSDIQMKVITYRYLNEFQLTYTDIGKKLNFTHERIRQIEKDAFEKIKNNYINLNNE